MESSHYSPEQMELEHPIGQSIPLDRFDPCCAASGLVACQVSPFANSVPLHLARCPRREQG